MNWEKLKIFYHVAKAGSFTHAGHHLNISQSSLSRQISDLESRLKTKLFKRYSGGVALTQEGEFLFSHAEKMYEATRVAEKFLLSDLVDQKGELKILITPFLGASWLMPHLKHFLNDFPKTRLSITDSPKMDNLHEYDVIISEAIDDRQDLIQKKLTTLKCSYKATLQYLESFGTPKHYDDLSHHRLIFMDPGGSYGNKKQVPLHFQAQGKNILHPFLRVNSVQSLVNAGLAHLGIIEIYEGYPGLELASMQEVLPEAPKPELNIYCIYPTEYAQSPRVKAFRESITASLKATPTLQ